MYGNSLYPESLSPSQITHMFWVYCRDDYLMGQYPNNDGKWMMFFTLDEIDAKWEEACNLYRSGRLTGINSMKVSTAKPNSQRIYDEGEGIIIFYCGPSQDETNVLEYGRNILSNMNYPRDRFYYKSDQPDLIDWSQRYRHMYFIDTYEFYEPSDNYNQNNDQPLQNDDTTRNNDQEYYPPKTPVNSASEEQNYFYSQPTPSKPKIYMSNRSTSTFSESPDPYSLFDGPDPYKQTPINKKQTSQISTPNNEAYIKPADLNSNTSSPSTKSFLSLFDGPNPYKQTPITKKETLQPSSRAIDAYGKSSVIRNPKYNTINTTTKTNPLALFDGPNPYKQIPIIKQQTLPITQSKNRAISSLNNSYSKTTATNPKIKYEILLNDRSSSAVPFYDNDYSKNSSSKTQQNAYKPEYSNSKTTKADLTVKAVRNPDSLYESADPYSSTKDSESRPIYRIVKSESGVVPFNATPAQTPALTRSASYQTYKPARSETPFDPYSQLQPESNGYTNAAPYFQPDNQWNYNTDTSKESSNLNYQYGETQDRENSYNDDYSRGYGNNTGFENNNYPDESYSKKNAYDYSFERSFNSGLERNGYENQYGYN
jgi:hypothetical protein